MPYANPNDKRIIINRNRYFSSKEGFIKTQIGHIFKPSRSKLRPGRTKIWKPECSREDVFQKLMNYVIIMKEKYPNSTGYICHYCKNPFTYLVNKQTNIKSDVKNKIGPVDPAKDSNFSIDRWNSNVSYTIENIRFCCKGCNNRKSSSTPNDWQNFSEARNVC